MKEPILDIGTGTGKGTIPFACWGYRIHRLEGYQLKAGQWDAQRSTVPLILSRLVAVAV